MRPFAGGARFSWFFYAPLLGLRGLVGFFALSCRGCAAWLGFLCSLAGDYLLDWNFGDLVGKKTGK